MGHAQERRRAKVSEVSVEEESMSNFYYGDILEGYQNKARPSPSEELVRRKCIMCGVSFDGTRTQKMCSKACKDARKKVWRERWVKKNG